MSTSRPPLSLPPPDIILKLPSHIYLTSCTVPPTTRRHTQTTQSYQPRVLHCPPPDALLKLPSHINLTSYTVPPTTRHHTQTTQSYQPHVLHCPSHHQTPYSNYPVISTSRPTLSLPPPDAILKLPSHIYLTSYTVPPTTRRHTQTTQSYQPHVLHCPSHHQTPYSNYPVISTSRPTLSLPPPDTILKLVISTSLPPPDIILKLPSHINLTSYTVPPTTRHHTQTTQSYQPHVLHCPSHHQTPYSNYPVISTSRPTLSLPPPDAILKLPSHIYLTSYTVPVTTRRHTQTTQSYQPHVLHCPSHHQISYSNYPVISTSRPTLSLPPPDTILKLPSHINLASYTVPPTTRRHTQTTQSYQPHVLHCPSQHQTPYSNYTVISTSRPTLSLPAPDTILKLPSHLSNLPAPDTILKLSHINLTSYTVPPSTRHHTQTTQSYQPRVLHYPSQHQTPYSIYPVISTSRPTLSLPAPDTILKLPSHINLASYTIPPSTRHHTQTIQSYQPHVLPCPSQHQTPYSNYPVISTSRPTLSLPPPDAILKLPSHINLASYTVPPTTRRHTQTTQSYQPRVLPCPSQHQTPYSNYPVISTSRPTLSLPAPDTILKLPSHINLASYTVPPTTRRHTQTTQSYQPRVLHCPSHHQTPYSNYPVISTSRPTLSLPAPDTILKLPSHINLASYTVPPTTRRHTQTTQSYQPRVLPCPSQHQTPYSNYPVISTSRPTLSLPPPDAILKLHSHINLASYTVPPTTRHHTQSTQSYQPRVLHCPSHHQTPYSNYTVISTSRPTLSLPPPDAILKLHSHINLASYTVPPTTRRHTQTTQSYQPRVLHCPSHHQTPYSNYTVISTSRPTLSLPPPDAILKLPSHINLASCPVPPTTRRHTQTTQSYQPRVLHCPFHHQTPYSNYPVISTSRPTLSLPAPDTILKLPSHINLASYTVPPTTRRHTQTTQSYQPRVLHCPFHHQTPYSNYPVISTSRPTLSLPPPDTILKLHSHIYLTSCTVPPTTRRHTQTTQSYQPRVLHCPSHHQTPYSNYTVISTSRPALSLPPPDAILKLPSHINLTSYTVPPSTRHHTQTTQSYQPRVLHCPSHHQTPYSNYPVISTSRPTLSLPPPDIILKLPSHINLTSSPVPPTTRRHTQTTQSYQPHVLHCPSHHQTPYSN